MGTFILWGVEPTGGLETLLCSEAANIMTRADADYAKAKVESLGCTAVRIQHLQPLGDGREVQAMFGKAVRV